MATINQMKAKQEEINSLADHLTQRLKEAARMGINTNVNLFELHQVGERIGYQRVTVDCSADIDSVELN